MALAAGRLNVGDQILVCDGVSLIDVTHDEAAQALKRAMDMESVRCSKERTSRGILILTTCDPYSLPHGEQNICCASMNYTLSFAHMYTPSPFPPPPPTHTHHRTLLTWL